MCLLGLAFAVPELERMLGIRFLSARDRFSEGQDSE